MRVVHFAPFAPCGCGLYEAARDMVLADIRAGHDAHLVDSGITINGEHKNGIPGQRDERGGSIVITEDPQVAYYADVIVAHAGYIDSFIVQNQAPVIWVMHGRPSACFRPEQFGNGNSYSIFESISKWPRVKAMLTFWEYHVAFWKPIIPEEKIVCFNAPPIDEKRFSPEGAKHDFGIMGGEINIAICESWREDVDIYETAFCAIECARRRKDVKFHFYGMESPLRCWEFVLRELRLLGALGEVWERRPDVEEIYRSIDILLSPQRIVTRTIGEAMSCGTPVVAARGNDFVEYTADIGNPEETADAIENLISQTKENRGALGNKTLEKAKSFSLKNYSKKMNKLYERITA